MMPWNGNFNISRGPTGVDSDTTGELQIYSVEEKSAAVAGCIVRCVGGVVRTGQLFKPRPNADVTEGCPALLRLDWIKCYGKVAEFLYPPYSAMVQLSGDGVSLLTRGVILASVANHES